jgi:hypothetical protein
MRDASVNGPATDSPVAAAQIGSQLSLERELLVGRQWLQVAVQSWCVTVRRRARNKFRR